MTKVPDKNFLSKLFKKSVTLNCFFVLLFFVSTVLTNSGCAAIQRLSNSKRYGYEVIGDPKYLNINAVTVSHSKNVCHILILGRIKNDTPEAFENAVLDAKTRPCEKIKVSLSSSGGSLKAAMLIGIQIRSNGFTTAATIGGGDYCDSACGIIFISGTKRELFKSSSESTIGFHQPGIKKSDGSLQCVIPSGVESQILDLYSRQMLPVRAANIFYTMTMKTGCNEITRMGATELVNSGIATGYDVSWFELF